ncbi:hypothetical protein T10_7738, partial [Trichinella papuae]
LVEFNSAFPLFILYRGIGQNLSSPRRSSNALKPVSNAALCK